MYRVFVLADHGEVIMAMVNPANYANQREALGHPIYPEQAEPRPPKKHRIRHLVIRTTGKHAKTS
jgi:hypothetical protein